MMDRNREARRGSMAAVNGGSLSRRRQQRTTNLRDSPDEDGGMEMQEPSRLRDRGVKKDRDRDRGERSSSRSSKRRRGERLMHGSSNREEGDDSSEESLDDDDDEEDDDASVAVRLPSHANSNVPSSSSSIQHQNHHHHQNQHNQHQQHVRKSGSGSSFLANNSKPVRPSAQLMKVSEEMIGVSIPRKARSSVKRPQEFTGSGELTHRQASTSPARPSPPSNTATSPPSSNVSIRKKKPISGSKHRPPKMAKSPASSSIQEIEIEVAEVLYGMTRQAPLPATNKQETNKIDSKDNSSPNGLNTDAKSRASSPNSQTPAASQQQSILPLSNSTMMATAPKRKRPRLRLEEESPTSSVAAPTKMESELVTKAEEVTSPRSVKNNLEAAASTDNGIGLVSLRSGHVEAQQDLVNQESSNPVTGCKDDEGAVKDKVGNLPSNLEDKNEEKAPVDKGDVVKESPREAKFSIDLMAPPPVAEKSSSDRDGLSDFASDNKLLVAEKKMLPYSDIANGEIEKEEKSSKHEAISDHQNAGNVLSKGLDLKKQQSPKDKVPDMHLDLEKHDKDGLSLGGSSSKQQQQQSFSKQQQKPARIDPKQEKHASSMPLPVPIAGWPGGFPSFGYMGQVPPFQAVVPMEASSAATNPVQPFIPQPRPKCCATHCYIARNIYSHQQFARMNPFWAAAAVGAASTPLYGTKQYNLNAVPPTESSAAILGNPLQAGFPPVSLGPLQDKPASKDKSSANVTALSNSNVYMDAATAQRKHFLLQQSSQPGSTAAPPNMIQGPAFLIPINQHSAAANQPGVSSKSTQNAVGNASVSPPATSAGVAAATTMSFNYAGLTPNDAQCMAFIRNNAILQNNAYPFPIAAAAAAHVGGPTPYRGANPSQAMPFFNGPFYSSQMVPSPQQQQHHHQHIMQQQQQQQLKQLQQQQQQQQQASAATHPHNNSSTSSGSSSSQKHTQQSQQRVMPGSGAPAVSNPHSFPTSSKQQPLHLMSQARQLENETACEDSPSSTGDSIRGSQQGQKGIYGQQNFAMPPMPHSQNFSLISPGTAPTGTNRSENKQQQQHQSMKDFSPSQVYAMSFASFGGSAVAGTPNFDFSAMVQNPSFLHNLPEVARHGYHIPAAAAQAAAAATATQHKKSQHEDAKSVGDSGASNNANAAPNETKIATTANASGSKQQSLSFSRPDNDPAISNIITNLADASSRAPTINGTSRALNLPASSTAPPTSSSATPVSANHPNYNMSPKSQQQQQHYHQQFIEFQRQQQRQLFQQQQQPKLPSSNRQNTKSASSAATPHNTSSSTNNAMSVSAIAANRFSPLSMLQGSGSSGASHSPQWKASSNNNNRASGTPAPASSATSSSSSAKNQMPQPQQQQQTQQISFGGVGQSSNKPLNSQSVAAINVGSPQNSVSKSSAAASVAGGGSNSGSPRAAASSNSKSLPSLPPITQQQQQMIAAAAAAAKHSQSAAASSNLKPSSPITANNNSRNMSSILGHPHITSSNNPSSNNSNNNKLHSQKPQQQSQKQPPFPQPQIFFNNPYMHQTQQNPQSNAKNSTAPGMLSLSSNLILAGNATAAATSDPAKAAAAAAASNIKGMTSVPLQAGILQSTQYAAAAAAAATSMAQHPSFMSFPYMHAMQTSSVSNKPASSVTDQKQQQSTTGNENVHACWKPEKR